MMSSKELRARNNVYQSLNVDDHLKDAFNKKGWSRKLNLDNALSDCLFATN